MKHLFAIFYCTILAAYCHNGYAQEGDIKGRIIDSITRQSNNLKEVTITRERPLIKQEVDRISYNLEADPESRSSSLMDMMKKVPLLSLDADENIQLKGSSNFKVLIDGRPSSMLERSPKDILRSIPASTIKRIEVITSPPAKYDGEGLSGIINIVTLKRISDGYNGGLNLSNRSPLGGPALGGSIGAKAGKFGSSANFGGSLYRNPMIKTQLNRFTKDDHPTNLSQQNEQDQNSRSGYVGLEFSYDPDTLNLLTAQFNLNGNRSTSRGIQHAVLLENNDVLQAYNLENATKTRGSGIDASMNYQHSFRNNKSRLLTISYRYYQFADNRNNDRILSDRHFYEAPSLWQVNKSRSSEQTLQADYVQRFGKVNMEGGLKTILRRNTSRFRYDEIAGSNVVPAPLSTLNYFHNQQRILAFYTSMQYSLKRWVVKSGLRLEQTYFDADFVTSATTLKRSYINMLPSGSLSYALSESHTLVAGYSRRIQRPGIYQLNPFVDRTNPDFEVSGNPEIRPIAYNALELGFSSTKKLSLFLNISHMFSRSMIFRISTYDPTTRVTKTTYENTGLTRLSGLDYSLKYPITQRNTVTFNGKLAYGIISRTDDGKELTHSGLMYRYYASATHRIKDKWYLSADVLVNGGNLSAQGQSNSFIVSSFKADRTLIKDRLSIAATVSNPFTKYRTNVVETSSPDFDQTNNSRIYFRVFNFSANYRFGKLKDAVKKGKRGIKNDDVSGNSGLQ